MKILRQVMWGLGMGLRKLAYKFGWFFHSRKRIALFITILTIIVGSVTFGVITLQEKNAFRAAEDDTELPGYDYVEYATMDLFRQGLEEISIKQLSEYDKIALITELAGANYFRYPLVSQRQELLGELPIDESWKVIARQVESAPEGAWQWLGWVEEYCGDSQAGLLPELISTAHAQEDVMCLLNETKNKAAVQETEELFKGYAGEIANLMNLAVAGNCHDITQATRRYYFKTCWDAALLDRLYNNHWKDLKSRRSATHFNKVELDRIEQMDRFTDMMISQPLLQAGQLQLDVTMELLSWAPIPVGRIVGSAIKIGGKVVTFSASKAGRIVAKLGANPATTKIATAAVQTVRSADRLISVTGRTLSVTRLNLNKMFSKSLIPKGLIIGARTAQEELALRIYAATDTFVSMPEVKSAIAIQGNSRGHERRFAEKVLENTYLVSSRQMAKYRGTDSENCRVLGCALGYEIHYNETALIKRIKSPKDGLITSEVIPDIDRLVYHEITHNIKSFRGRKDSSAFAYSSRLGYRPLEEGAVESTAVYLFKKYNPGVNLTYLAYDYPADWFNRVIQAIGRGQASGKIKLKGTPRQISMDYLYGYGLDALDDLLRPGLPRGANYTSFLARSFVEFNEGNPQLAIDLANSLFR